MPALSEVRIGWIMGSNDKTKLALAALNDIHTGVIHLDRYTADATWWWNIGSSWPIGEFATLLADLHALEREQPFLISPSLRGGQSAAFFGSPRHTRD